MIFQLDPKEDAQRDDDETVQTAQSSEADDEETPPITDYASL